MVCVLGSLIPASEILSEGLSISKGQYVARVPLAIKYFFQSTARKVPKAHKLWLLEERWKVLSSVANVKAVLNNRLPETRSQAYITNTIKYRDLL